MTERNARKPHKATLAIAGKPEDRQRLITQMAADPIVRNAVTADMYVKTFFGDTDLAESIKVLRQQAECVQSGNLKGTEAILVAQASTLDAIFTNLSLRAMNAKMLNQFDTFLRLGLRAQAQCRATLETLAAIKNPPVVFAKQANIAHGHQQVNNGTAVPVARAETETQPTELLEQDHAQRLDTGTAGAASNTDSVMATVATIDRAANASGQSRRAL